jgi:hypothetical protein
VHAYKPLLLIVAILLVAVICAVPATALAARADETVMFRYNAQRTADYSPMAKSSTSNGVLNWKYTTEGILASRAREVRYRAPMRWHFHVSKCVKCEL